MLRRPAAGAPFVWHDEFYKECYPKLYGLALRYVRNAQLAQGMVQDAFRILFEKWAAGQLRPDESLPFVDRLPFGLL